MEPPLEGGTKVEINGAGHMTKMAAVRIYDLPSRTRNFMTLKHGRHHQCLKFYKIYINDDPSLNLTYLTARSNLVTYTFEWGKLLQRHLLGKTCSK